MSETNASSENRFPLSSRYDKAWLIDGAFGANPLWLAEWLCQDLTLRPGMKVLDLGCGRAKSSIFLAKEFDVDVWAVDLWIDPEENRQRIAEANLGEQVTPLRAEADALPFEKGFFDAVLAFDSIQYFGTNCLFLPYIIQYLKPKGVLGFASAGLISELHHPIPNHLKRFWVSDCWCLHTAEWWKNHWGRTDLVKVLLADTLEGGWRYWLEWAETTNCFQWYLETIAKDAGRNFAYIRAIAEKAEDAPDLSYDLKTGNWVIPPEEL